MPHCCHMTCPHDSVVDGTLMNWWVIDEPHAAVEEFAALEEWVGDHLVKFEPSFELVGDHWVFQSTEPPEPPDEMLGDHWTKFEAPELLGDHCTEFEAPDELLGDHCTKLMNCWVTTVQNLSPW